MNPCSPAVLARVAAGRCPSRLHFFSVWQAVVHLISAGFVRLDFLKNTGFLAIF